jgi:AbrB family looped-hinge helix DNA binding protein
MRFTTVATTKGQLTIPKEVRQKLNLKTGVKIDIYPTADGFIGRLHKPSRIFDFLGDMKHLDKKEPLAEIRRKAQENASKELVDNLQ